MKDIMHHLELQHGSLTGSGRNRRSAERSVTPVYRVGEYFRRNIRTWPEGAEFTHSPTGFELTIFRSTPDLATTEGVRNGRAGFALIIEPPVLVLAYRFDHSMPWSDVPYYWHLRPQEDRNIPLANPLGKRALLWITLVDATTGVICAQRGVTLSPDFTSALFDAIRSQAMVGPDPAGCTSAISRLFLLYPKTIDRIALAKVLTEGNE